jgi:uncharacterized membrane protein
MQSETARVEAFSDGVFAIAITLLILEIKIPNAGQGHLSALLLRQWPSYLAFLISFAFIGIMWINHHRLFNHIRRADNTLLVHNLLLLLGVCIVPFPTAVLASFLSTPDWRTAAFVFNATYVLIAIFFNLLWHHAVRAHLLDAQTMESADAISRQYAFGPLMYLACAVIGWFSLSATLTFNILLAIYFALPPRPVRHS